MASNDCPLALLGQAEGEIDGRPGAAVDEYGLVEISAPIPAAVVGIDVPHLEVEGDLAESEVLRLGEVDEGPAEGVGALLGLDVRGIGQVASVLGRPVALPPPGPSGRLAPCRRECPRPP